ncbi:MAG: DNA helicase II, partial [Acetobacteraceae bacterium]
ALLQPSRFIAELPEEATVKVGSASLERAARLTAPPSFATAFPRALTMPRATPWHEAARPARARPIAIGARVFHEKFGYGIVTAAEAGRLDIAFDKAGDKRVLDRFVELA